MWDFGWDLGLWSGLSVAVASSLATFRFRRRLESGADWVAKTYNRVLGR